MMVYAEMKIWLYMAVSSASCMPDNKQLCSSPKQECSRCYSNCNYYMFVKEWMNPFHMAAKLDFLPKTTQYKHTMMTTIFRLCF